MVRRMGEGACLDNKVTCIYSEEQRNHIALVYVYNRWSKHIFELSDHIEFQTKNNYRNNVLKYGNKNVNALYCKSHMNCLSIILCSKRLWDFFSNIIIHHIPFYINCLSWKVIFFEGEFHKINDVTGPLNVNPCCSYNTFNSINFLKLLLNLLVQDLLPEWPPKRVVQGLITGSLPQWPLKWVVQGLITGSFPQGPYIYTPEWPHRQCVGLAFRRSHDHGSLSAPSLVICSPHCSVQYVEQGVLPCVGWGVRPVNWIYRLWHHSP